MTKHADCASQNHINTKCPQFKDPTKNLNYNKIMENDNETLQYEAIQIN